MKKLLTAAVIASTLFSSVCSAYVSSESDLRAHTKKINSYPTSFVFATVKCYEEGMMSQAELKSNFKFHSGLSEKFKVVADKVVKTGNYPEKNEFSREDYKYFKKNFTGKPRLFSTPVIVSKNVCEELRTISSVFSKESMDRYKAEAPAREKKRAISRYYGDLALSHECYNHQVLNYKGFRIINSRIASKLLSLGERGVEYSDINGIYMRSGPHRNFHTCGGLMREYL